MAEARGVGGMLVDPLLPYSVILRTDLGLCLISCLPDLAVESMASVADGVAGRVESR